MNNPLISIIVPVYNMEKYLSYCVDSLLRQTYENLEILLIDDGSKDNSLTICREYAARDSRCKVYHQENGGVGAARNLGLRKATADYIAFVDSDDYIDEKFIEILYSTLVSGDYDFSMVNFVGTFNHHEACHSSVRKGVCLSQKQLMNCLYNRMQDCNDTWEDTSFIIVTTKLYKRSLLEGLSFSSSPLSEDLEFNNQVYLRTRQAIFTDMNLYFYFQNTDSVVHRPVDEAYISGLLAHARCLDVIPVEQKEYRAACLMKLFKSLFSTRFAMRHLPQRHVIDELIGKVGKRFFNEFMGSRYIPTVLKFLFLLFYKIPKSYRWFVAYCELKGRRKKGRH